MKKTMILLISALFLLAFASVASADTVEITTQSSFSDPSHQASSSATFAFKGTRDIVFNTAGKTCKLNGSARGSVPMGCNYKLTVAPDGSITGTLSAGNSVCTQSSQIASSCK